MVLYGINLKKQAMFFQPAHIMPHNINKTYNGKVPLFVILFGKKKKT